MKQYREAIRIIEKIFAGIGLGVFFATIVFLIAKNNELLLKNLALVHCVICGYIILSSIAGSVVDDKSSQDLQILCMSTVFFFAPLIACSFFIIAFANSSYLLLAFLVAVVFVFELLTTISIMGENKSKKIQMLCLIVAMAATLLTIQHCPL